MNFFNGPIQVPNKNRTQKILKIVFIELITSSII